MAKTNHSIRSASMDKWTHTIDHSCYFYVNSHKYSSVHKYFIDAVVTEVTSLHMTRWRFDSASSTRSTLLAHSRWLFCTGRQHRRTAWYSVDQCRDPVIKH